MRPFLKWAGNKFQIIERLIAVLPKGKRLIEPFVGSGAVFLNIEFPVYLLADSNSDLIQLYSYLQAEGEQFIHNCEDFFQEKYNTPDAYYKLRDEFNLIADPRLKAEIFLYLNKHGYNGLCRYNIKGEFNVPFGRYKKAYFPAKEMQFFYQRAQTAEFLHADFVDVMQRAIAGDIVYCDPPYVPLSDTANFTHYNGRSFNVEQHIKLAQDAEILMQRGIHVVISNHDTEFTRELYVNAKIIPFDVQRHISCDIRHRNKAHEIVAIYSP